MLAFLLVVAPGFAAPIAVWIDEPSSTDFVFGDVDFEAAVQTSELGAAVEFYLDGVKVTEL